MATLRRWGFFGLWILAATGPAWAGPPENDPAATPKPAPQAVAPAAAADCAAEIASQSAIPWSIDFWGDIPNAERPQWLKFGAPAFKALRALGPAGDHLFKWAGNRDVLAGKTSVTYFFVTYDTVKKMPTVGPFVLPTSDAGTLAIGDGDQQRIYVFLFVDRFARDPATGAPREDVAVRLLAALAHETYGNVQRLLETDRTKALAQTPLERAEEEVKAFTAGVAFMERFQAHATTQNLDAKLRDQIAATLDREKKALEGWKQEVERRRSRP